MMTQRPQIYLGYWDWDVDPTTGHGRWRAPGGDAIGVLDLRSRRQSGTPGPQAQGLAVFVYPGLRRYPQLTVEIGDDPQRHLEVKQRAIIEELTGSRVTESRFTRVLQELRLASYNIDPTGRDARKPLLPRHDRRVDLPLGPYGDLLQGRGVDWELMMECAIRVRWADYRRQRRRMDEYLDLEGLQRSTGAFMQKMFGRLGDDLLEGALPPEYISDGWLPPHTTILDSFNRADAATLGTASGGFSWTSVQQNSQGESHAISSNQCVSQPIVDFHESDRADTDLSSDDHYSQVSVVALPQPVSNAIVAGSVARFSGDVAAGTDQYWARLLLYSTGNQRADIAKYVDGVETEILADQVVTFSLPDTMKAQADGTTISGQFNGSEFGSVSDSDITGILRTGIHTFNRDGDATYDNFEAADLAINKAVLRRRLESARSYG